VDAGVAVIVGARGDAGSALPTDREEFLAVVKRIRDQPPTGDAFAPIPASDAT
jgi:hypothetical protein